MTFKYDDLEIRAKSKEKENWAFRGFLKSQDRMSERALDRLVHEITDRVWAAIDCRACGRCCREISPSFSEKDVNIGVKGRRRKIGAKVWHFSKVFRKDGYFSAAAWAAQRVP
ncbi:MAG: hypothetical protein WC975_13885, partial [Phycisphaerae bacterium]